MFYEIELLECQKLFDGSWSYFPDTDIIKALGGDGDLYWIIL